MSLAAMILADRSERSVRFYDRWIGLITLGRDVRVRSAVLAGIAPGERLLDIGCGTGTLAVEAARIGARVVAIDRSAAMLSIARGKAARAGVAVDWRQGEASFPPLDDGPYDVATATFVLSELSIDLARLSVHRMAEAVRPGGRIVIADEATPTSPILRLLTAIPRALLSILSFAVLQQLAPTRRHPWWTLLLEAGLDVTAEQTEEAGGLVVLTAIRPPSVAPLRRPVPDLEEILPSGVREWALRAGAWLDLPIGVTPGAYLLGRPGPDSPVLLTGNFLASVEAVRDGMAGEDAFLLVEDTDGWNVWCAADAGIFNGEKAAALLELHGLADLVAHRRIVIPRLGGRVRSRLAALSGWDVVIGPIEARDLPRFLDAGPSPEMHSLRRLYRLPERVRVAALTLLQLPLFLLPLRWVPAEARRPARVFGVTAAVVMPLAHDRLPGRTGIAKATYLGLTAVTVGAFARRMPPAAAIALLVTAPVVGWVYQSSSPVVFWKRLWR
jgi:ubiquinone/menaquinone biosynthesis C-methylase UbiE